MKDPQHQQGLLDEAIAQKFSLNQIRARVAELNRASFQPVDEKGLTLKERVDRTYRRLKKSNVLENPKKQKQLEKLLGRIEALLDN